MFKKKNVDTALAGNGLYTIYIFYGTKCETINPIPVFVCVCVYLRHALCNNLMLNDRIEVLIDYILDAAVDVKIFALRTPEGSVFFYSLSLPPPPLVRPPALPARRSVRI